RYDSLGRPIDTIDADRGETITTYDAMGEILSSVDANGQSDILSRDAVGRVFAEFSTQDGATLTQWDSAAHGVGKVASTTSPSGVVCSYAYDSFSRPVESRWTIGGTDFTVDTALDASGRVLAVQYPAVGSERFGVTFGFDASGAVNRATSMSAVTPVSWSA